MLSLGSLAFASPWLLVGLTALPILWWLLKVTPPPPRRLRFPAIALLFDLREQEQTPHKTPLWLVLLRMVLAALVICALARPLLNPSAQITGGGPILLVVDDGWAAAPTWRERQQAMENALDRADRAGRPVILLTTAAPAGGEPLELSKLLRAQDVRSLVQSLAPKPWPVDRGTARAAAERLDLPDGASVIWVADGIEDGESRALAERLQRFGSLEVIAAEPGKLARALPPPSAEGSALVVRPLRADGGGESRVVIRGTGEDGRLLLHEDVVFQPGETVHALKLEPPAELRNQLVRLAIEGEDSAAAVVLLDERWRRRPVGIVAPSSSQGQPQPLMSAIYYLDRALSPFSEVRNGPVADLLRRSLAVIVLPDEVPISESERNQLRGWMENGGTVLRFAGNNLATKPDDLTPVRLRGGRALGGALSWAQPATLAPFEKNSPFFGLTAPNDVRVTRQVLAEPSIDLAEKTWARLADGTPLVTADRRNQGSIVLVHTTANPEWSNLPLSGLFVDMLRRIVAQSHGVTEGGAGQALPPLQVLDGFGHLQQASATVTPLPAEAMNSTAALRNQLGPTHPPGFYGNDSARVALNLAAGMEVLRPMAALPSGAMRTPLSAEREIDLRPWLLAAALALAIIDLWIGLGLRGLLPVPASWRRDVHIHRAGTAVVLVLAALVGFGTLLIATTAAAQTSTPAAAADDATAIEATKGTKLAYVRTGDSEVDRISRAGLQGLGNVLRNRTSVEPEAPAEVDLERDELAFYPFLYWPMTDSQPRLSPRARDKLISFLRSGGTILFDTRDAQFGTLSVQGSIAPAGPGGQKLRQILDGLEVPALMPTPQDHILTKAFYLIQDFPGRWQGSTVWVEQNSGGINDGVSSIIIGSSDWAGAWATVGSGSRPMLPVTPGGEAQREMAYRFGVNLVMYVLTGNYKADQVHVPAILERLGQ